MKTESQRRNDHEMKRKMLKRKPEMKMGRQIQKKKSHTEGRENMGRT
jgi:hypothetical protein